MSLFVGVIATCPACSATQQIDVVASVNADRRPDLREAILAGTFQAVRCGSCGAAYKVPPHLTYLDVGNGQWILAVPPARMKRWNDAESAAVSTFEGSFGAGAPAAAREIGKRLAVRVTFGWPALQEKLRCRDAGLDDVTLELVKTAILANVDGSPIADDLELRLLAVEDDTLVFAWLSMTTEAAVNSLRVPRAVYDEIAAAPDDWAEIRGQLDGNAFVDIARFLVPPAPAEDAA